MKRKNVGYALLFLIALGFTSCVCAPPRYAYGTPPPPRHHWHHYNGW